MLLEKNLLYYSNLVTRETPGILENNKIRPMHHVSAYRALRCEASQRLTYPPHQHAGTLMCFLMLSFSAFLLVSKGFK